MNIYGDQPEPRKQEVHDVQEESFEVNPFVDLTDVLNSYVDFNDSVIYFSDDIGERTIVDIMIRFRSIIKYRESEDYNKSPVAPINLILNSPGGEIHEMMGFIDYINSIKPPVNIIIRGKAFSAAAVILASASGKRMASANSTIMFHQPRSMMEGKLTDVTATLEYVQKIEQSVYSLLAKKSKKDITWWKDNMRSDLYLSAEEAKEIGVIDIVI